MQDQQVIEAFLSHTSQEALADGIGSGCMNRRFEDLDRARFRHTSKARPKLAIIITNQIRAALAHTGWLPVVVGQPRHRSAIVSLPRESPCETSAR